MAKIPKKLFKIFKDFKNFKSDKNFLSFEVSKYSKIYGFLLCNNPKVSSSNVEKFPKPLLLLRTPFSHNRCIANASAIVPLPMSGA